MNDRHASIAHMMIASDISNLADELHDRDLDSIAETIDEIALITMTNAIHDSRRARLTDDALPTAIINCSDDDAPFELAAYCDSNDAPACCIAAHAMINAIYDAADYND